MNYIVFFLALLGACADPGEPKKSHAVTEEQRVELTELSATIATWAPTCGDGYICEENSDGDSLLWAGLSEQCTTVFDSQVSSGRLYRSPARAGVDTKNSFSRDMLLGYLNCLITTKNTESATAFLQYIQANDYKMCDDAVDNRCDIGYIQYRPMWGLMLRVWEHMGLEPSWEMRQADYLDDTTILTTAKVNDPGYQLHLVSVQIYLRQRLDSLTPKLRSAKKILVERQPLNPWYQWLYRGPTRDVAARVLEICPAEAPAHKFQWAWQRDTAEAAWKDSMGHDCIFIINRLLE